MNPLTRSADRLAAKHHQGWAHLQALAALHRREKIWRGLGVAVLLGALYYAAHAAATGRWW